MTYGAAYGSEDNLTSFTNAVNLQGATEQQTAQDEAAQLSFAQEGYTAEYTAEQANLAQYNINQQVGQQAEGYASGGVEPGQGTPLMMTNVTKNMGALAINAIQQQGAIQGQYYEEEGQVQQQTGLEDLISAEGQNEAATQQNEISQANTTNQFWDSMLTAGVGGVTSAATSFGLGKIFPGT